MSRKVKKCRFRTKQLKSRRLKKCRNYGRLLYKSLIVANFYESSLMYLMREKYGCSASSRLKDELNKYSGDDYLIAKERYDNIRSHIPPMFEIKYVKYLLDLQVNGLMTINLSNILDWDYSSFHNVSIIFNGRSVIVDMFNLLDGFVIVDGKYDHPLTMCGRIYIYKLYIGDKSYDKV